MCTIDKIKRGVDMEIKKILSSKLKCMSGTARDLINMGMWFLYEVDDARFPDVAYFLSAERDYYFLASDGKIMESLPNYPKELECKVRILFDDIPFPESIDNFQPAWA